MQDREVYQRCADRIKALTNPYRLQIVYELFGGERPVSELVDVVNIPLPLVSHQLGVLRKVDLVEARREGRRVYYALHSSVRQSDDLRLLPKLKLDCFVLNFEADPHLPDPRAS